MDLFQRIPIWSIFLLTFILVVAACEGGFRAGASQKKRARNAEVGPVGAMVGVILSLTAFILAFTFGVAAERFNDRRVLIIEEANSIGTTFLRSDFLPEKNRQEVQTLLRQYVAVRLVVDHDLQQPDQQTVLNRIAESEKIQDQLWAQAVELQRNKFDSPLIALFVSSLNDTIDLQSKRVTACLFANLPGLVWIILYLLIAFGTFGLGYQYGLAETRNWAVTSITAVSFALVMLLIADLDRPLEGNLRASKQPLTDLARSIGVSTDGK